VGFVVVVQPEVGILQHNLGLDVHIDKMVEFASSTHLTDSHSLDKI
jgi:hypothetical protein